MKHFIVYKIDTGRIQRTGSCPDNMVEKQAGPGEAVFEGKANDVTQKIVNGRVIDKTQQEIEADRLPGPEDIPEEQRPAMITQGQLQQILNRIETLEGN